MVSRLQGDAVLLEVQPLITFLEYRQNESSDAAWVWGTVRVFRQRRISISKPEF